MSVFLRKYFWLKFSAKCPGIRLVLLFCETNLIAGRSGFCLSTHVYMELWMSDNFIITLPFWYIYIHIYNKIVALIYSSIDIYIIYISMLLYIYIYIYTFNNSTRHLFKTVIFRIFRIFNRLLQKKSVKKYILIE